MERKRGRWNWGQVEQARSEAPAETVEEGTGSPSWLLCHVQRIRAFSSLLIRNYRILWSATVLYMAAMQGNFVAQSWLAYKLTGSGVALALVALALNLPQFILSPFAGAVADRFDKRVVLIGTMAGLAACTAVNALLVQLGTVTIWYLVAIALGQGIAYPFSLPTRTAFISDLVSERQLPNALAMDATSKNLDRIFAPTLAGVLIAWSPAVTFWIIALLYVLAAVIVLRLPASHGDAPDGESVVEETTFAFHYILRHPQTVALMALAFVTVMLGVPFQRLLPVFQQDVLRVGPSALGIMFGAIGVGSLAGSLSAAYLCERPDKRPIMLLCGVAYGVCLAIFAFSTSYLLALLLLALVGLASQVFFTIIRILITDDTDKPLYGRVMGIYMSIWSVTPLALLPMGVLVDHIGPSLTVGAAAVLMSLLVVALCLTRPTLRARAVAHAGD